MSDTFDPFDLPSSFDPLDSDSLEPTGQSAYSRQSAAPTGQSACSRRDPPPHRRREVGTTATAKTDRTVNPRLAHLLPRAEPPATEARPSGTASDDTDPSARLATLEDEVAILTARLDDLQRLLDDKLEGHQNRLLRAVGVLIDDRLARR